MSDTPPIKEQPWFKHASAIIDGSRAEQAFAEQSYTLVANRAGALMRDPHRLGFEVVWKNDTATQLVGMYAFRVPTGLLYVPVFFLNGSVKGGDMLHEVSVKKFRPLTEDWVTFLLARGSQNKSGYTQPRSNLKQYPVMVMLDRLAEPPEMGVYKSAAHRRELFCDYMLEHMLPSEAHMDAALEKSGGHVLKDYLASGPASRMERFCALLEKNAGFADLVGNAHLDLMDLQPGTVETPEVVKQACAPAPRIRIHTDLLTKSAAISQEEILSHGRHGVIIEDSRPKEQHTSVAMKVRHVAASTGEITGLAMPCMADVMDVTFNSRPAALLFCDDRATVLQSDVGCAFPAPSVPDAIPTVVNGRVVWLDDGTVSKDLSLTNIGTRPLGEWKGEINFDEKPFTQDPSPGDIVWLVDRNRRTLLDRPVLFHAWRESPTGLKEAQVYRQHHDNLQNPASILINPDLDTSDPQRGIYSPKDVVWLVVVGDKTQDSDNKYCVYARFDLRETAPPATESQMSEALWKSGGFEVSLRRDPSGSYEVREYDASIRTPGVTVMDGMTLLKHAMQRWGMSGPDALMLREQAPSGSSWLTCQCLPPDMGLEKSASVLMHMRNMPEWQESVDVDSGATVFHPQKYSVPVDIITGSPADPRIGDRWQPDMGRTVENSHQAPDGNPTGLNSQELAELPPERLAELASMRGIPRIFEHGIVGTLSSMDDATTYIEHMLPKLEDQLDSVGRLKFLFHWRPKGFEANVGVDDMPKLEADLNSAWQVLGRLVLMFLRRNRIKPSGGQHEES